MIRIECIACGLTPEELEVKPEDFTETEEGFLCPFCIQEDNENNGCRSTYCYDPETGEESEDPLDY